MVLMKLCKHDLNSQVTSYCNVLVEPLLSQLSPFLSCLASIIKWMTTVTHSPYLHDEITL
jgi:hypothetical protein